MFSDPIPARIRAARVAAGLSLRDLAARVSGLSHSYLSLIENGHKVPDANVARAIAAALGDEPALYEAWVALRKRSDLATVLAAARRFEGALGATSPSPGDERRAPIASLPRGRLLWRTRSDLPMKVPGEASSTSPDAPNTGALTRVRVPLIREGADPGDALRPACEVLEWLRLDAASLPDAARERLDRPFAWRTSGGAHADRLTLVTRDFLPLSRDDAHAVRHDGRVSLARVAWNGRELLVVPAADPSDFRVTPAPDESALRRTILGSVWTIE